MNKTVKAIIAAVLCGNLLTTTVMASELDSKKEESNNIQQKINESKEAIKALENTKSDILKEVEDLNNNISVLDEEVEGLNLKIKNTTEEITALEKKLNKLKEDLEKNKKIMEKRMRALYMNQGQGYVETLLQSKGLSDFLEKIEVISTLIKYDKGVIEDFKKNQEELDTTLITLETEHKSLESSKALAQTKLDELNTKRDEKNTLVAKAEEDIESQQKIIAQNEEEYQKVAALIKNLESPSRPSRGGSGSTHVSDGNMFSITGGVGYQITSPYGYRDGLYKGDGEFHPAIDIGAPYGSGVYSLMSGTVVYAGWMNGYGNVVIVNHGDISTLYAHNSKLLVTEGQQVQGGEQISVVGSTGWSTGPHIHFEVRDSGGQRMDPTPYYIY
ncbi:murein DD-endopeptidase MepM/ murein hydrolase activator NlpD [Clostridium punense]|uniref:Murein DD-endopeptidase MepM/ murein hydrolase activator NlpD n=1 Tax=Clostridium punense TaxID=1054297 RepID=A0ABS4K4S9_9CLOT|nr:MULTISPECIES: M23 family metallopeptidase [Clostridium]EQB88648.1 hypothetical protein M918_23790 [Clostridium sp. BL8]MBP2022795.1 murein DD-endopeptidase MepM/ murein hydrolase activator NlpD [Clostridium punense]